MAQAKTQWTAIRLIRRTEGAVTLHFILIQKCKINQAALISLWMRVSPPFAMFDLSWLYVQSQQVAYFWISATDSNRCWLQPLSRTHSAIIAFHVCILLWIFRLGVYQFNSSFEDSSCWYTLIQCHSRSARVYRAIRWSDPGSCHLFYAGREKSTLIQYSAHGWDRQRR